MLLIHFFSSLCAHLCVLCVSVVTLSPLYAHAHTENKAIKRVYAHLLIHDPASACEEAFQALHLYPHNKSLWEAYINALAKAGREKEMVATWKLYAAAYPDAYENRELLENMAWGVISQGTESSLLLIRTMAMLGAFFAQDAHGVDILHKNLSDTNSLLRSLAVQLSSKMQDAKLKDEVWRLLREDPVWQVRFEAIKAVGNMQIKEAWSDLLSIISSSDRMAEEKAAAIQSLVLMLDTVQHEEVVQLAKSDRAGLRLLACEVVIHCGLERDLDQIIPLLNDHSYEVRAAALEVIGNLRVKTINQKPVVDAIEWMLSDSEPTVAITAAWVVALNNPSKGQQAFQQWMQHEKRDVRIFAAAALAACGKYGLPYMYQAFRQGTDPYVRMNLALGLIGQRTAVDQAGQALYEGLTKEKRRWMWQEDSQFRALVPSTLTFEEATTETPEQVDLITRLDILNRLAVIKDPRAQSAMLDFLNHRQWGISGIAAALLLTEGDDSAIDLVKDLLSHPVQKVRLQAALILALWGREESAIALLEQTYPKAKRELKEKILEGIGRVGAKSSIPFLASKLEEPAQSLRIIAACALLQTLNH